MWRRTVEAYEDSLDPIFELHRGGKIHVVNSVGLDSQRRLSSVYTPGVAEVCRAIQADPSLAYEYTIKGNSVAVVTDGSAVLGLGNIGPLAAEPVMSGKAMLFREFGLIDAFPICLATQDVEEIIATVKAISPVFGGINLEDISSPRCFEIESRLDAELDIPVFHDDQHGTAVVVLAGLINALRLTNRDWRSLRVVIAGIGAAGVACTKILLAAGVRDIVGFDRSGAVYRDRPQLDGIKSWFAANTNHAGFRGTIANALDGADVFIGVSGPNFLKKSDLQQMAADAVVFAMANPNPEILPDQVAGTPVRIIGTGRSDYPNQINNSLAFPGIFRGALDAGATTINEAMKLAAARAIAGCVDDSELETGRIVPAQLDRRVAPAVASAVARAARESGVVRNQRVK
jgi:malate dehydrogenase (oxaloacetate-decarboxylating)